MNTMAKTQSSIPSRVSDLPVPVDPPKFTFEEDRWSTTREHNVAEIANHWRSSPNMVRVLTDKKFGPYSMVLLRKDTFEHINKLVHDIQHGEIVLKTNLEFLFDQIKMVTSLYEQTTKSVPQINNEPFKIAIKNLTRVTGQIQSVLHFVNPPKPVKTGELSAEELSELEKLEKNK